MVGMGDFAQVRQKDAKRFPGPGSYALKEGFGTQSGTLHYSIARKIPTQIHNGTGPIGPGEYEIKPLIGQSSNFRKSPEEGDAAAGASARSDASTTSKGGVKKNEGPVTLTNPKQYHMAETPSSPRYSILGKPKKKKSESDELRGGPGPGAYTLGSTLTKNGVSLLGKAEAAIPDETPGPGGYDIARFGDGMPKPMPPAPPKTFPPKDGVPGPGSYDISNTIANKCKPKPGRIAFTSTFPGRNFLPDPTAIGPGPAGYPVPPSDFDVFTKAGDKPMNHVKGATIFGRHVRSGELDAIFPQPGPGEYVIPGTFDGAKAISISPRIPQPPSKLNPPGPGGYNEHRTISETLKSKHHPGMRFDGNRAFDKSAAYSRSPPREPDANRPGPTTYDYHNYDIAGPDRKGFSLSGRDGKNIFVSNVGVPGPGTYTIKESAVIPFHGGGVTFHKGQFNDKRDDQLPGPGAYNDAVPNTSRSWTMGMRAYDNW
jgi:hypothetical protein